MKKKNIILTSGHCKSRIVAGATILFLFAAADTIEEYATIYEEMNDNELQGRKYMR